MPDIQTLTSQVRQLENAHSFWSTWSVYFIAATLIVTGLYFFAQWMTNRKGNELSEAQAALIRAKDEQLAGNLKDKDVHIAVADEKAAEARATASKADEGAARANERAQNLEQENIKLRTDLESATAEARAKQAELAREQTKLAAEQSKTARAQEEAAKAQKALAEKTEEVRKRQEPRRLNHDKFQAALKDGNKATALILYQKDDPEAYLFAMDIFFELSAAEWNVPRLPMPIIPSEDPIFSQLPSVYAVGGAGGVTIVTREITPFGAKEETPYSRLAKAFLASGMGVSSTPDVTLPNNAFRIIVGPKP